MGGSPELGVKQLRVYIGIRFSANLEESCPIHYATLARAQRPLKGPAGQSRPSQRQLAFARIAVMPDPRNNSVFVTFHFGSICCTTSRAYSSVGLHSRCAETSRSVCPSGSRKSLPLEVLLRFSGRFRAFSSHHLLFCAVELTRPLSFILQGHKITFLPKSIMAPISSYAYAPIPVNLDHGESEPYHLQEGLNENTTSDLELRDRRRQLFLVALTSLSLLCLMILSMALGRLTVTNFDCGRQLSTWCKLHDRQSME